MAQTLTEKAALCYRNALEARRRAGEETNPEARNFFSKMESHWLLLAKSYDACSELIERMDKRERRQYYRLGASFD